MTFWSNFFHISLSNIATNKKKKKKLIFLGYKRWGFSSFMISDKKRKRSIFLFSSVGCYYCFFIFFLCFSLFPWQRQAVGVLEQYKRGERKIRVVMESTFKEMNGGSVLDLDDKSEVGGGVEDVYGEDRASEDQAITPWTVSVAR